MWALAAVFAALILGAIMLGQAGNMSNQGFTASGTEVATGEAEAILSKLKGVYSGSANGPADFSTITNATAIKAGAISGTMTNGDGQTITGPWKNPIYLSGSSDGGTIYQDWTAVPNSACAKFAVSLGGVNGVFVNGTWVPRTASGWAAQVTQQCNQGVGSTSDIKFSSVLNYD